MASCERSSNGARVKESLLGGAARWLRSFARVRAVHFENRAAAYRIASELTGYSRKEAERRLADIGLSQSDLAALSEGYSIPQQLVPRMMERLGIGRNALRNDPAHALRISDNCRRCDAVSRCEEWLAAEEAGDSYPWFCPNLESFLDLAERRKGALL